jgi:hypothetical protein
MRVPGLVVDFFTYVLSVAVTLMFGARDNQASITVNQDGIGSFASALLCPQEYEIFIDDQKIGVLNGYRNCKTCTVSPEPHSIYVRAFARDSVTITRVYGYSHTIDVNLASGETKRLSCGVVKGPPLRTALIFTTAPITAMIALGLGPMSHIPERARYATALVMACITMACSWYGHSSTPGTSIYLKEG